MQSTLHGGVNTMGIAPGSALLFIGRHDETYPYFLRPAEISG